MEQSILSIFSIVLFCACCRQFIKVITTPIPMLATERRYARPAMQVGKAYKVMAWGSMTGVFLMGTAVSFYQVFSSL